MNLSPHAFNCGHGTCRNGLDVRATNPATARARATKLYGWAFRITNPGKLTPFCHAHNN